MPSVSVCTKSISKSAITELYKSISYETLGGARDLDSQAVSDLILAVNLQIKRLTLLNKKRKEEEDNETNLKIKEERDFFEQPDQFEEELIEDLFKPLEHKKNWTSLRWSTSSGCWNNRNRNKERG